MKIPIRHKRSPTAETSSAALEQEWVEDGSAVVEAPPPVVEQGPVALDERQAGFEPPERRAAARRPKPAPADEQGVEVWRDRALRLQAEIENFRKRQRRLAEERIEADRGRLLRAFLSVADDLERALAAEGTDAEGLRQGVGMTYQALRKLLEQEGVEHIEAGGRPFDPLWHEAVGTVPHQEADAEPGMVVGVAQAGYRLGERLLRPARVVVAA